MNDKNQAPPKSEGRRRQKRKKRSGGVKYPKMKHVDVSGYLPLADFMIGFHACGRCGYFIMGYQVLVGIDGVKNVVAAYENDGWLHFPASHEALLLLNKSFGVRSDIDAFYHAGHCEECNRIFEYRAGEEEGDWGIVTVETVPGNGVRIEVEDEEPV